MIPEQYKFTHIIRQQDLILDASVNGVVLTIPAGAANVLLQYKLKMRVFKVSCEHNK